MNIDRTCQQIKDCKDEIKRDTEKWLADTKQVKRPYQDEIVILKKRIGF